MAIIPINIYSGGITHFPIKVKFREFLREIKGFITVEYVVLFNEADGQDTF